MELEDSVRYYISFPSLGNLIMSKTDKNRATIEL